ncbi:serine protease [Haemophilus influenzae]|uniref:Serine protease n=3 Tax=Haemophilus TaxID=724 RepID=A0A2X1PLS3_HAEIF|nr:serine protease [Haemophilus influenzae]
MIENIRELNKVLETEPSAVALNILRGNSNFYLLVQ